MILAEKTLATFGYESSSLTSGSKKRVCLSCDYCGVEYDAVFKNRVGSNKILNKDACVKCKFKKRDDVNLINYGVKNPSVLKSVKDKIKQSNIEKYGCESYTQTEEFKNKSDSTKLEKYGTTNIMTVKSVRDSQKATMMKNYGVDNPTKSQVIKDRVRETNLERYGATSPLALEEFREKGKSTSIEKYGTEFPCQSDEIKDKIKQTNLTNLGVEYPMQNKVVMSKAKETNIEKYGVENVFQSDEIKKKIKKTNIEKYGCENPSNSDIIKAKSLKTSINNGYTKVFNNKTILEWSNELNKKYHTFRGWVRKFGFDLAITMEQKESSLETLFKTILTKYNLEYEQHAKIDGRISDFLLEKYNILIEIDGNYWHSDANKNMTDKKYHMKKQKVYSDVGYESVFFREHELVLKKDIVESVFLNRLNLIDHKIDSSNCEIVNLSKKSAKKFFVENHLNSCGIGATFALKLNNEVVSAIQIKNNSSGDYQITRFCDKKFTVNKGSFLKLLNYIEKTVKMNSLKMFIDMRYEKGDFLKDLGFIYKGTYLSFKWTNGLSYANKNQFSTKDGYEQGFNKLYDCGQAKFLKTYN